MSVLHGGAPSELWSSPARSAPRTRERRAAGNGADGDWDRDRDRGARDEKAGQDDDDEDVLVLTPAELRRNDAPAAAAAAATAAAGRREARKSGPDGGLVLVDMLKIKTVSKDGLFGWAAITVELRLSRIDGAVLRSKGLVLPRARTDDAAAAATVPTILEQPEGKWSLRLADVEDVQSFGGSACRFDLVVRGDGEQTAAFLAATPDTCQRWVAHVRSLVQQRKDAQLDAEDADDIHDEPTHRSLAAAGETSPVGRSNDGYVTQREYEASAPEPIDDMDGAKGDPGAGLDRTWAEASTIDGSLLHADMELTAQSLRSDAERHSPSLATDMTGYPDPDAPPPDEDTFLRQFQHQPHEVAEDLDEDQTQDLEEPSRLETREPRRKKRSTSRASAKKSASSPIARRRAKSATARRPRHVAVDLNSSLHRPTRASIGQRHSGVVAKSSPLHRRRQEAGVKSPKRPLRKRLDTTVTSVRISAISRAAPTKPIKSKIKTKTTKPKAKIARPANSARAPKTMSKTATKGPAATRTTSTSVIHSRRNPATAARGGNTSSTDSAPKSPKSPKKIKITKRELALRERCRAQEVELARLRHQLQTMVDGTPSESLTRQHQQEQQVQDLQAQVESLRAERDAFERLYLQRGAKLEQLQLQSEVLLAKLQQRQQDDTVNAAANMGVGGGGGGGSNAATSGRPPIAPSRLKASSKTKKSALSSAKKSTAAPSTTKQRRGGPQWGH